MFSNSRSWNRRIAMAVAALLSTALLAGCSGQPAGSTTLDKKAKVSLTVWTGQEAGAEKLLDKLGAKFTSSTRT
jgi:multiple sugar transport system substrate-binding protein